MELLELPVNGAKATGNIPICIFDDEIIEFRIRIKGTTSRQIPCIATFNTTNKHLEFIPLEGCFEHIYETTAFKQGFVKFAGKLGLNSVCKVLEIKENINKIVKQLEDRNLPIVEDYVNSIINGETIQL